MSYWNSYDDCDRSSRPIRISVASYGEDSVLSKRRNATEAYKKRKKKKRCPCGNTYKIRELIDEFAKSSTMHGAAYLAPGRDKMYTCFWRTLLMLCIIGMILSVGCITQDALVSQSVSITTTRKETTMGRKLHKDFPIYPGITICRMPPYETGDEKLDRIYEYSSIALGYPFASLTIREKSIVFGNSLHPDETIKFQKKFAESKKLYEEYVKDTPGFSLRRFLSDSRVKCEHMFVDCIAEMVGLNCCEIFQPVLTNLGTCYSFQPNEPFMFVRRTGENFEGFSFYLDLLAPLPKGTNNSLGFSVFVTDPFIKLRYIDYESGIMVSPGLVATFSLTLDMTNREELYDTWFGVRRECPRLPSEFERDESKRERYRTDFCFQQYMINRMKTICNCASVLDYDEGEQDEMEVCQLEHFVRCSAKTMGAVNESRFKDLCKLPCTEFTYSDQVTYAALDTEEGSDSKCRIVLHYYSEEYIYNEYNRYTASTYLSQIGGAMGLLLGASVITSIEFVIFVVKLIWHRFIPFRRTKKIAFKKKYAQ